MVIIITENVWCCRSWLLFVVATAATTAAGRLSFVLVSTLNDCLWLSHSSALSTTATESRVLNIAHRKLHCEFWHYLVVFIFFSHFVVLRFGDCNDRPILDSGHNTTEHWTYSNVRSGNSSATNYIYPFAMANICRLSLPLLMLHGDNESVREREERREREISFIWRQHNRCHSDGTILHFRIITIHFNSWSHDLLAVPRVHKHIKLITTHNITRRTPRIEIDARNERSVQQQYSLLLLLLLPKLSCA